MQKIYGIPHPYRMKPLAAVQADMLEGGSAL